jgi:hypothetical protein
MSKEFTAGKIFTKQLLDSKLKVINRSVTGRIAQRLLLQKPLFYLEDECQFIA